MAKNEMAIMSFRTAKCTEVVLRKFFGRKEMIWANMVDLQSLRAAADHTRRFLLQMGFADRWPLP